MTKSQKSFTDFFDYRGEESIESVNELTEDEDEHSSALSRTSILLQKEIDKFWQ